MLGNPDWSSIFAPHGVLLRQGEIVRRTNYSRTLAAIADLGSDAFYKVKSLHDVRIVPCLILYGNRVRLHLHWWTKYGRLGES